MRRDTNVVRVVYYTMRGCRHKDFSDSQAEQAMKFYERHKAKYPEYQNSSWSKTEIVTFKDKEG
jgi:hypothetical protein